MRIVSQAATLDELRDELIAWHEQRASSIARERMIAKTIRDKAVIDARVETHDATIRFLRGISLVTDR